MAFKKKLKLRSEKISRNIEGLQMKKSQVQEKIGINMRSNVSEYETFLNAVVMDKIVSNIPSSNMMAGSFPENIKLADPNYNIPKGIDLLLSNQFIFDLIIDGKMHDEGSMTKLQNTKLGWVAYSMSKLDGSKPENNIVAFENTCDKRLEKFWEIEEVPQISKLSVMEKECEKLFDEKFKRTSDGKFKVGLPFKEDVGKLGNSRFIAKRRFLALERKLENNPHIKDQYDQFMQQYLEMGHMEEMSNEKCYDGYYLPHHCVLRPESTTTKLRVVFDSSCKTTNNISLNDMLHTGPRLQEDLFNILLRFRKHRYVFSADVEKMYRQIWVEKTDRKYQLIFWRWNQNQEINTYALKTVT
ncbi:uncharacterized protein LOC135962239 [Calliphora vicina]|uniref:uncharacterized protein LOC135962239 n=1 Tax=Calliphora vicina TaxID=7373 RepID=UPI00325A6257